MLGLALSFGRAFIVGGLIPSILFVVFALVIFGQYTLGLGGTNNVFEERPLGLIIALAVPLAFLILALNAMVIKIYEGAPFLIKNLLRVFLNKNLNIHKLLYEDLLSFRTEYEKTDDHGKKNSLAQAVEKEWKRIYSQAGNNHLPMDKRRIMPTRMGNVFACIEEYPSIRYGMDGMFYWPRLVSVISDKLAEVIGVENINFIFLLNLSLLSGVLGAAILVGTLSTYLDWINLGWSLFSVALFYLFYRLAVGSLITMGELMKSGFDLYRHEILRNMKIEIPDNIQQERQLWFSLTNYLASGEIFYYPNTGKGMDE